MNHPIIRFACVLTVGACLHATAFAAEPWDAGEWSNNVSRLAALHVDGEWSDALGNVDVIDSPYLIDPWRDRAPAPSPAVAEVEDVGAVAPPAWTVSATPYGVVGSIDAHGTHPSIEYWSSGAMIGLDHAIDEAWTVGVFGGLQYTKAETPSFAFITEERQVFIGGFVRHRHQAHHTLVSLKAGYNFYKTRRDAFDGSVARSRHEGWETLLYAEHGVTFEMQPVNIQPFVGLQHYHMYTERFTEYDAGMFNITFPAARLHSLRSVVGARVQFPVTPIGQSQLLGELRGAWSHEFLDAGFKTSPSQLGRDAAILGAAATLVIDPTTVLLLDYNVNFSEHHREHVVFAMLRLSW